MGQRQLPVCPAIRKFTKTQITRLQRMTGERAAIAESEGRAQGRIRAIPTAAGATSRADAALHPKTGLSPLLAALLMDSLAMGA